MMERAETLRWLLEEDDAGLRSLWAEADRVRQEHVGDDVHLRGLIELSNYCSRECLYCGIRDSRRIPRYRMPAVEVMECARLAVRLGYGTVVLQAGEDPGLTGEFIAGLVRRIKADTPLAVTLSLGERSEGELAEWREAGADRYLLKYETSDVALFHHIHPARDTSEGIRGLSSCGLSPGISGGRGKKDNPRIRLLKVARTLGYEIGSGVMVGIPGQTFESVADDIMLFRELDLDMVGCGPFIPHPDTPLGNRQSPIADPQTQVPASDVMTTKVVALSRLVCPDTNIPATTALATVNSESGRELGLARGANVWMPNVTPVEYRAMYEIYPGRACSDDSPGSCNACLLARLQALGREPGRGPGSRRAGARGSRRAATCQRQEAGNGFGA